MFGSLLSNVCGIMSFLPKDEDSLPSMNERQFQTGYLFPYDSPLRGIVPTLKHSFEFSTDLSLFCISILVYVESVHGSFFLWCLEFISSRWRPTGPIELHTRYLRFIETYYRSWEIHLWWRILQRLLRLNSHSKYSLPHS